LATFYISDNCSSDETPEIIAQFARQVPKVVHTRNATNIGGDNNIFYVRTMGKGRYVWVLGDDELLSDRALVTVLTLLKEHEPGLIIAHDSKYELEIPGQRVFADYREFARECIRRNPHALAEHTLITSNIFRADCFDEAFAKKNLLTSFPHMYGMIHPLMDKRLKVVLPGVPVITIRDDRPGPSEGQWINLDHAWVNYFTWLREELQLPELDPSAPSEHARKAMIRGIVRHPLRYMGKHWRSLFEPKAYQFVFNRFFRRRG
jgi:glycosyltransferase involved in cell wall biosynthesis